MTMHYASYHPEYSDMSSHFKRMEKALGLSGDLIGDP
jgi:hypothetical protein